jgi:DNA gyrase inhibitor GyrI
LVMFPPPDVLSGVPATFTRLFIKKQVDPTHAYVILFELSGGDCSVKRGSGRMAEKTQTTWNHLLYSSTRGQNATDRMHLSESSARAA